MVVANLNSKPEGQVGESAKHSRRWSKYCRSLAARLAPSKDTGEHNSGNRQGARERRVGLPEGTRCSVYMVNKTRYCSRPAVGDTRECFQHTNSRSLSSTSDINEDGAGEGHSGSSGVCNTKDGRIACELCGVRIKATKLKGHLSSRCGVTQAHAKLESQPYFQQGVNAGREGRRKSPDTVIGRSGQGEPLLEFADRVAQAHAAHVGELRLEPLCAQAGALLLAPRPRRNHQSIDLGEELRSSAPGSVLRQLHQQDAIVARLARRGLVRAGSTYVEFGAGKGMLSLAVSEALQPHVARFLLIEKDAKGGVHNKADRVLKPRAAHPEDFARLEINIKDLKLAAVPMLTSSTPSDMDQPALTNGSTASTLTSKHSIVAISKHLCGVATDLSIRCLKDYATTGHGSVEGLAIALCCHHCCNYADYVGKLWWEGSLGFSCEDFDRMVRLSGWATGCRPRVTSDEHSERASVAMTSNGCTGEPPHDFGETSTINTSGHSRDQLTPVQMVALGRQCKQLIDLGRAAFLRSASFGLQAELVIYCEEETSAENCLLLAW
eukprot:CAMPEP_0114308372 /NCGR_PEP_ID=MMETSP0059-20121206/18019_1 /TAXON_ID=36894 /ORGANISM="Pyramimonas parkeae, Strain CCMP726" /LENGTH=550 /DNA_ID=CAMNT_0001432001 /DNA_START=142 /DNA_END=1791 /DNA_ORIENTATION=+